MEKETELQKFNKPTAQPSGELSQKAWVSVQMDTVLSRHLNQAITKETAKVYMNDWCRLADRYGQRVFEKALQEYALKPGQKYFPMPGELAEMCEQVKAQFLPERKPYQLPATEEQLTPEERKELWAKVKAIAKVKSMQ